MANVCATCHLDFGSVKAFDAHRVGKHAYLYREGLNMEPPRYDGRRCLDEDEMLAGGENSTFVLNAFGRYSLTTGINSARRAFSVGLCTSEDDPDEDDEG